MRNFRSFLTESRVAIALSAAALLMTVWQAIEANRANSANEEKITIELRSAAYDAVICEIANLQIRYSLLVINNSAQPAIIKDASWKQNVPEDEVAIADFVPRQISYEGLLSEPVSIPAKGYYKLDFVAWTPISKEGYKRLIHKGFCKANDIGEIGIKRDMPPSVAPSIERGRIAGECLNSGWPKSVVPEKDINFEVWLSTAMNPKIVTVVQLPSEVACEFERDAKKMQKL